MAQLAVVEIWQLHEVGEFLNWLGDLNRPFGLKLHEIPTPEQATAINRRAVAVWLSLSDEYYPE